MVVQWLCSHGAISGIYIHVYIRKNPEKNKCIKEKNVRFAKTVLTAGMQGWQGNVRRRLREKLCQTAARVQKRHGCVSCQQLAVQSRTTVQ